MKVLIKAARGSMSLPGLRLVCAALFVLSVIYSAQSSREASLSVRILDAGTGQPTPVRVLLTDSDGNTPRVTGALAVSESALPIPDAAIPVMYGRYDRSEGYLLQPDGSFYVDGSFEAQLPPGTYSLKLSKGYEFVAQTVKLNLNPGESLSQEYKLERWINMPRRGWYSGDDHIHLRRSPRDDPTILRWAAAEDVHVAHLLQMGDFWATYYSQYAWGSRGRYREGDYILSPGQEGPRTPEIGHTISLGAEEFVRFRDDYYNYGRVFDQVHELGGITGFAHQAMTFHGYRGMTLNVLRGKLDFLEVMQFCPQEGPLALKHYYHFLDLGYKLTALGGSDFPWCGRGPRYGLEKGCSQIGDARFYTYTGDSLSFDRWLQGVKAGRTFVTSGPMLEFTVNDRLPGATLDVEPGTEVRISAKAYGEASQIPLRQLEIVGHGKTLTKVSAGEPGQSKDVLSIEIELPVERGIWVAARADAAHTQVAHTTPVYIRVNGASFHNPTTADHYLELCRSYLKELEEDLARPGERIDNQAARHKQNLERQITETRAVLRHLASRLGEE